MKFALFLGCQIPAACPSYETWSRRVLGAFKVELIDIEFGCCGQTVRGLNFEAFVLAAAKNLALAEQAGLDILTLCKCGFGNLKHAQFFLRERPALRDYIDKTLRAEGLIYRGEVRVKHILSVLAEDIGSETIRERVVHPWNGLKVAVHYGCHALRPSRVTSFDDPLAPTVFETLVQAVGAEPVDWPGRLQCCGNPLWGQNNELSLSFTRRLESQADQAGVDLICNACTRCQVQFHTWRGREDKGPARPETMSVLYSELLGVSLGFSDIESELLGLPVKETAAPES